MQVLRTRGKREPTPSELREILRAFQRGIDAASADFPVIDYVLVTNRDMSAEVQKHYGRRDTPFEELCESGRSRAFWRCAFEVGGKRSRFGTPPEQCGPDGPMGTKAQNTP